MTRDRLRGGTTLTFRGGAVTLGERLRSQPGLEGLFVAPPGDHQPLIPVVGRLQQFVTLESVRIVNGSGACGESVGQFVTRTGVPAPDLAGLLLRPRLRRAHAIEQTVRALDDLHSKIRYPAVSNWAACQIATAVGI